MSDPPKLSTQLNTVREFNHYGYYLQTPPVSLIVLDPAGDGNDGNGIVWMDREEYQKGEPEDPDFSVIPVNRIKFAAQLDSAMEWSDVMARLLALHRFMLLRERRGLSFRYFITVEVNGVGYGYANHLKEKVGTKKIIKVTTVGGQKEEAHNETGFIMPRLPGLDHLRMRIEGHTFKIDKTAPGLDILNSQMRSFVWLKKGRPEALPGQRDDLVMSSAIGNWTLSKIIPPALKAKRFTQRGRAR